MKTHDFDRRMRVLAGQEVFAMSKESENRLRQALHSPQIRPAARRLSLRAVLVTALILALCGGIAVAATVWGSEMLLRQPEGKTVLPVNESVQSEALKLEIIDAVFDGKAIALAWTHGKPAGRTGLSALRPADHQRRISGRRHGV